MTLDSVPDDTLARLVHEQAIRQPDAPAILAPGRAPVKYAALWQEIRSFGGALRAHGPTPVLRVAVALPNGPDMALTFLAVAAHAVCVPMNPAAREAECRMALASSGADVLILACGDKGEWHRAASDMRLPILVIGHDGAVDVSGSPRSRPPGAAHPAGGWPQPQDTALILPTSGTTGQPKIVPLSHGNLVASARQIAAHLALRPEDRCLNVMPLFHIHGLVGALLATVAGGGSIVCAPGFEASDFFSWIADFDPSWTTAVPTVHQAIVDHGARYRQAAPRHRFRFIRSSSAALPTRTLEALQSLTGAPVIEAYGMTEASHQMASNPLTGLRKPGSVGLPAGADISVRSPSGAALPKGTTGEVMVRGPGLMRGYENAPQANAEAFVDGWFRTGDLGRIDDDGYLFIAGRLKEMVNRGGEKIVPREVDEALLAHPDVRHAAAFAAPHPTLGEDLVAAVVLRQGAAASEHELRSFLFERLSAFKVPSSIVLLDALPTGATGKVQRSQLHRLLSQQLAASFVAPSDDTERTLESIIRAVLNCGPVGVHDNFFALGGDSLKGAQFIARIRAELGVDLPVTTVFTHPTLAALALQVQAARTADAEAQARLLQEIEQLSDEEVARLLAEEEAASSWTPR